MPIVEKTNLSEQTLKENQKNKEQRHEHLMKKIEAAIETVDPRVQRILNSDQARITLDTSPHLKKIARERQEIRIDPTRCTKPGRCLKCTQACSFRVFAWTWHPFHKGKDNLSEVAEQGNNRMIPMYPDLCTFCNRCVEVCPEQAITITPGAETQVAQPAG